MKINKIFVLLSTLAIALTSCQVSQEIEFDVDVESGVINIGPDGGLRTISVKSPSNWTATTQAPWITISPANGKSSTECRIIIDSTL